MLHAPKEIQQSEARPEEQTFDRDVRDTDQPQVECQCISVSHEKALYITDDYIVTHNTAVMLHLAKSAARSNIPVAIFSLEMSDISLANRLILSECDVDRNGSSPGI